ncbi:hypothetical protein EMCRGX_G019740 [Ephydatia muelleri]
MVAKLVIAWLVVLSIWRVRSSYDGDDVRLTSAANRYEGRLEVFHNGTWGVVCSSKTAFSYPSGDVVCKQLGYASAAVVRSKASYYYGVVASNTTRVWMDNVRCTGKESSLLQCSSDGWGVNRCSANDYVGLQCNLAYPVKPLSMPVRLSCPVHNNGSCTVCPDQRGPEPGDCTAQPAAQGIVEAFYNNQWRAVTLRGWNMNAANVVCGELGYPLALGIPTMQELWPNFDGSVCSASNATDSDDCNARAVAENDAFRNSHLSVYLQPLTCTGAENRLLDCYFPAFGPVTNPTLKVATVTCGFQPHQSCLGSKNETYRLRGAAVPWTGRVEVKRNGQWGTICDAGWNNLAAGVVCRALGYGTPSLIAPSAYYGRGFGVIHYTNVKCTGREGRLSNCSYQTGLTAQNCGHRRDVGVVCRTPYPACFHPEARLTQFYDRDTSYPFTFLEVNGPSGWGSLCYNDTLNSVSFSDVVCREASSMFSYSVMRGVVSPPYRGPLYSGSMACNGTEWSVSKCSQDLSLVSEASCPNGQTVVQCTPARPDLVPEYTVLETSLRQYPYLDIQPIYNVRCAMQENCLAPSAYSKPDNSFVKLLRFSSESMNWGRADALPALQPYQWTWHACHNHYHSIESFVSYELYSATNGSLIAVGHKASFCLEDSVCAMDGGYARYACSAGSQGISVNCGDMYGRYLDCQWIDVTDVPPGRYSLQLHVNPRGEILESDFTNNRAGCTVQLMANGYVQVVSACTLLGN